MDKWKKVLSSPIRWAGSKTTVLNELLSTFEKRKKNYVEPFLGSGTVLINVLNNNDLLEYDNFYVNDSNLNVISFYRNLKENTNVFIEELNEIVKKYNSLKTMEEKSDLFYEARELFNQGLNKNVFFYFLMKAGFNGVYRENKKGDFNVPFGKKEKLTYDSNKLLAISKLMDNVFFYSEDYSKFLEEMKKKNILSDAFVYCDPPYIPDDASVYKTQTLYSMFSFDHIGFYNQILSIINDNCDVVISMSDSKRANEIYNNEKFIKTEIKDLVRIVNPKRKFGSKEIVFKNRK